MAPCNERHSGGPKCTTLFNNTIYTILSYPLISMVSTRVPSEQSILDDKEIDE